jgi:hypothetical protein
MKNAVGCGLIVVAAVFGVIGAWAAMFLAPWGFVGSGPPDYGFVILCYSPLVVAACLLGAAIAVFLKARPDSRAMAAEQEAARLRTELETLRREQDRDGPAVK